MRREGKFWLELYLSVVLAVLSLPFLPHLSPLLSLLSVGLSLLPFSLSLLYSPLLHLFSSLSPSGWKCGENEEAETWTVSLDWTTQQRRGGMS